MALQAPRTPCTRGQWWNGARTGTCQSIGQGNSHNRSLEERVDKWLNVSAAVKLAACVQLIVALDAAPVYGIDRSAYQPRRHHRRLGEEDSFRPISESRHCPTEIKKKKAKKGLRWLRKSPKVKEINLSIRSPFKYTVQAPTPSQVSERLSDVATHVPAVVFAPFLLYAIFSVITRMQKWIAGQSRKRKGQQLQQGRMVRDRSLGGKEIFIQSETLDWNPLGGDTGSLSVGQKITRAATTLPSWWRARLHIYVDESRKGAARLQAQRIIKQLDDLRISGRDYAFDLIVELYRICTVCPDARTSSTNVASSIFRYTVRHTVMLVSEGIELSYGLETVTFFCVLSEILNLASEMAVSIIYSEIAARLRSTVLQVFADVRSARLGQSSGFAARAVIRLLRTLPIQTTDAELIGSSITSSTTEEERIQVYSRLCQAGPEFTELIGKLLGKVELQTMDE